jgi:hypothetical protein
MSSQFADPSSQTPRPRRPLGKWILLLLVWCVGIVMWILYLALAAIVFLRIL